MPLVQRQPSILITETDRGFSRGFCAAQPCLEAFHIQVEHRCNVQREKLRHDKTTDDCHPERLAGISAFTETERDRESAKQRGHRCHHDRPETEDRTLIDRFGGSLAFDPLASSAKSIIMIAFFFTTPNSMIRPTNA